MKFLVWSALVIAGLGYWLAEVKFHKWEKRTEAQRWSEQDNTDTANAVERMFNR